MKYLINAPLNKRPLETIYLIYTISCFKPDKPCSSDGRKLLSDQMCLLNDTSLDHDPFQSPTESDIEDAGNEMLLIEDDDVDIC